MPHFPQKRGERERKGEKNEKEMGNKGWHGLQNMCSTSAPKWESLLMKRITNAQNLNTSHASIVTGLFL